MQLTVDCVAKSESDGALLHAHMHKVKGGAYMYSVNLHLSKHCIATLHLYGGAIAEAIARGLSLHKRSRLHFVRGSRDEAARVAEEAKIHFETGGCSSGNGFSALHSSREYGHYEQFRGSNMAT